MKDEKEWNVNACVECGKVDDSGEFIDWCIEESIGNMNSGVGDSQFVLDAGELVYLIWDYSSQGGKLQKEFEK